MSNVYGRYVLDVDVLTPMGMNLDISLAVAKADLARFNQQADENGIDKYTYAKADFIKGEEKQDRAVDMIDTLLSSMLSKLPKTLKPVPVIISVPESIENNRLLSWIEESEHAKWLSKIDISHVGGPRFIHDSLSVLNQQDAVICIAVDSLFCDLDSLITESKVMGSQNPWGLIPSEGGAGVIFTKKNIIETLKLKPIASLEYFIAEWNTSDRRGMMRLVRKAGEAFEHLGRVYSDMNNSRNNTEDYGFALGARAEKFTNPQQPFLINDLWGTLGQSSAMALLGSFTQVHKSSDSASLFMYGLNGDRGLLRMSLCDYK
ncbi:hypothetical protein L1D31_00995 [Vibrio sp. Isolate23]|uniref:hypothetical protein n=1 Tax=Vibrio sp. Isolate23 TaxID=2908533 RepID=UPI001EFC3F94|nr:hypothetical protein [Vibrio sp. Isolate23]MCG9681130.1 hypothetical protein [Vibrio sp. Isolate23]